MDKSLETRLITIENELYALRCLIGIKTQVESVFKLDCPNCKHPTLGFRKLEESGCEFYYCGSCGKKLSKEKKTVWSVVE